MKIASATQPDKPGLVIVKPSPLAAQHLQPERPIPRPAYLQRLQLHIVCGQKLIHDLREWLTVVVDHQPAMLASATRAHMPERSARLLHRL